MGRASESARWSAGHDASCRKWSRLALHTHPLSSIATAGRSPRRRVTGVGGSLSLRRPNCILPAQLATVHGLLSPREAAMSDPFGGACHRCRPIQSRSWTIQTTGMSTAHLRRLLDHPDRCLGGRLCRFAQALQTAGGCARANRRVSTPEAARKRMPGNRTPECSRRCNR
jgi:hypothetical protein